VGSQGGSLTGMLGPVSASVSLDVGQIFLRAAPVDAGGTSLAGAPADAYVWSTSDPSVARVSGSGNVGQLSLKAKGKATLSVALGPVATSTEVTVP